MAHNLHTSWGVVTRFITNIPRWLQGPAEEIQPRLSDDLKRRPNKPKALRLIREMYVACLDFSIRIGALTWTGSCGAPGLLSDKMVYGVYQRVLEDALVRLRETIYSLMDEPYDECCIEQQPSSRKRQKEQR